jgi:hypothetical protein
MSWDALNVIGREYGAPAIDYDRFAARWESDPIMKELVDKFDGSGLTIKTDAKTKPEQGAEQPNEVEKMAKRATKLGK